MTKREKIIAACFLTALSVGIGGLFLAASFLQRPEAVDQIFALLRGAEYLGTGDAVLQTKRNNCGPSALQMIFEHYGIASTVEEIETTAGLTEEGTSMLALKEMAELKGLQAEGWKLTLRDLVTRPFPALLFVDGNHYIVVDSVKDDTLFLRDPAAGKLKMNKEKLKSIWNGETLLFYRNKK